MQSPRAGGGLYVLFCFAHAKDKDDSNPASCTCLLSTRLGSKDLLSISLERNTDPAWVLAETAMNLSVLSNKTPLFGKPYVRMVCTLDISIKDTPTQLRSSGWVT
jgi:hypothetical protein